MSHFILILYQNKIIAEHTDNTFTVLYEKSKMVSFAFLISQ